MELVVDLEEELKAIEDQIGQIKQMERVIDAVGEEIDKEAEDVVVVIKVIERKEIEKMWRHWTMN